MDFEKIKEMMQTIIDEFGRDCQVNFKLDTKGNFDLHIFFNENDQHYICNLNWAMIDPAGWQSWIGFVKHRELWGTENKSLHNE